MKELIKRLRDGTTVPLMEERHAVADALEAQQAEISSFCMNYRMKCDEETKSLHIQIEAQQARIAELREALETCLPLHMTYAMIMDTCKKALSHTDNMAALSAHNAAVRKAALLEAAEWFADVVGYAETGRDIVAAQTLRHMAEGE